jgi:uncharacterized protein YggE
MRSFAAPFARSTILIAFVLTASAQQPEKHVVRASAEASVTGNPDQASLTIGVRNQAATAKAVADQNAVQTAQVLRSVKAVLGSNGRLQTSGYSIGPYFEQRNNLPHLLNGFEANNSVQVIVDDLSVVGALLDAATANGANNIVGVSFGLKDDSALRLQGLAEANGKARAAAEAIAQALNLKVVGVASAESGYGTSPVRPYFTAQMLTSSTPIETGTLNVTASVTVTLEVNP